MVRKLLFISLLFINSFSYAQFGDKAFYLVDSIKLADLSKPDKNVLDSILPLYHSTNNDSLRIIYLSDLAENLWGEHLWPKYNILQYQLAKSRLANSKSILKTIYYKQFLANAINNIGFYHKQNGQIKEALEQYTLSLKIRTELMDDKGIGESYNNLGLIYIDHKNYTKALQYENLSYEYSMKAGYLPSAIIALNRIAIIYKEEGKLEEALKVQHQSLELCKKTDDKRTNGLAYYSMGVIYEEMGKIDSSIIFYRKALKLFKMVTDKQNICKAMTRWGHAQFLKGETKLAHTIGLEAFDLAQQLGFPEEIRDASDLLSNTFRGINDFRQAYSMQQLYYRMRDSVISDENKVAMYKNQANFEYERKIYEDSLKNAQSHHIIQAKLDLEHEKLESEKSQSLLLYCFLALLIIFSGFVYNRMKVIQKQSVIIEKQNADLFDKSVQITDNIQYAQRIQQAMLPKDKMLHDIFFDSFVYYKPKDIVSGDFYFLNKIDEDRAILVVADCTGHGVSGAFMSILGINILERVMLVYKLQQPNEVLKAIDSDIYQSLSDYGLSSTVRDGMDMSVVLYDKKAGKISYSGAHSSMYLIRDKELQIFKGNNYHIGRKLNTGAFFTQHEIDLKKDDAFILLTDGYCSQKGGPEGTKFYPKYFREFLLSISELPMTEQCELLDKKFEEWKGNQPQIDDVLVLGFRV